MTWPGFEILKYPHLSVQHRDATVPLRTHQPTFAQPSARAQKSESFVFVS
jgi:hypothetical protein